MIISYEDWKETYQPVTNKLESDRGYNNTMFETYGMELEFVKESDNELIWTLIDGENGNSWIVPGFHIINRQGFFICNMAWTDENILVNDNELINVNDCSKLGFNFIKEKLKHDPGLIPESWKFSQICIAYYLGNYADDATEHFQGKITVNDFDILLTEYIDNVLEIEQDIYDDELADFISSL